MHRWHVKSQLIYLATHDDCSVELTSVLSYFYPFYHWMKHFRDRFKGHIIRNLWKLWTSNITLNMRHKSTIMLVEKIALFEKSIKIRKLRTEANYGLYNCLCTPMILHNCKTHTTPTKYNKTQTETKDSSKFSTLDTDKKLKIKRCLNGMH